MKKSIFEIKDLRSYLMQLPDQELLKNNVEMMMADNTDYINPLHFFGYNHCYILGSFF